MQVKHTSPIDLAEVARQALTYRPTQLPRPQILANAKTRRVTRPDPLPCPTLLDAECPSTYPSIEAMRMAAHAAAACREITGHLRDDAVLVSIVAGASTDTLAGMAGTKPLSPLEEDVTSTSSAAFPDPIL